jgi:hypothetical protein
MTMTAWAVTVCSGLLGTLLGLILGHRLALGRDKRKEYNDIVRPLNKALEDQSIFISAVKIPDQGFDLQESDFTSLYPYLSDKKKIVLRESLKQYYDAQSTCMVIKDRKLILDKPEVLQKAVESLKTMVKLK